MEEIRYYIKIYTGKNYILMNCNKITKISKHLQFWDNGILVFQAFLEDYSFKFEAKITYGLLFALKELAY